MYLTGDADREPLQGPGHQPAYLAGAHALAGAMMALWAREAGVGGQRVEVSQMESVAAAHQWTITRYNYVGMIQRRMGNRYDFGHPNTYYACRDGHVAITVVTEEQAERFFLLLGQPELLADERFSNNVARLANADALDEIVCSWFADRTKVEIVRLCQELRVPCAPVSEVDELLEQEHLNARGFWREVEHPEAGRLRYPGPPFEMSAAPGTIERAPLLGEHNEEIYRTGLGYTPDEVASMRTEGVI
jgi:crotonobetainyl-CoA:carnitine CoA-transferase CaiB-like acyl-CoA transferase